MVSARGPLHYLYKVSGESLAVMYVTLSMSDMVLSVVAFMHGVAEGNPAMAWLVARGLFIPGKVALTVLAAGLIARLYPRGQGRGVAWMALLTTAGVNAYHVWALILL